MEKGKWLVVLTAVSLLTIVIVGALLLQDEHDHQLNINGDKELREAADRNDWNGNGSPEDPFVMTVNIRAEGDRPCISVSNTTLHITIKGCTLKHEMTEQGGAQGIGLRLDNVTNVSLIGNAVSGGQIGLLLSSSSRITMVNNTFGGMGPNLIRSVFDSIFESNIFTATEGSGLEMSDCQGNSFSFNSFEGNVLGAGGTRGWVGLVMSSSFNNTFLGDQMRGAGYLGIGMSMIDSDGNRFDGVHFNGRIGLYMKKASSNDLSSGVFGDAVATAIKMVDSHGNRIVGNDLTGNYTTIGIEMASCTGNIVERNAIGFRSTSGHVFSVTGSEGNRLFRNNLHFLRAEGRAISLAFDDTGTIDKLFND